MWYAWDNEPCTSACSTWNIFDLSKIAYESGQRCNAENKRITRSRMLEFAAWYSMSDCVSIHCHSFVRDDVVSNLFTSNILRLFVFWQPYGSIRTSTIKCERQRRFLFFVVVWKYNSVYSLHGRCKSTLREAAHCHPNDWIIILLTFNFCEKRPHGHFLWLRDGVGGRRLSTLNDIIEIETICIYSNNIVHRSDDMEDQLMQIGWLEQVRKR